MLGCFVLGTYMAKKLASYIFYFLNLYAKYCGVGISRIPVSSDL